MVGVPSPTACGAQIVATLAEGPRSVRELAAEMPVSRPAVSQHLKVLREAGLVSEHQEGTRHISQLNPIALAALRDQLDTYWRRALTNYTESCPMTQMIVAT